MQIHFKLLVGNCKESKETFRVFYKLNFEFEEDYTY